MKMRDYTKDFVGYSKEAKSFVAISFVDGVAHLAFWFTLWLYMYHLGFSLPQIGVLGAAGTFVSAAAMLPAGYMADKFGRKRVVIIGAFLTCVATSLFLLAPSPYMIFVASSINGLSLAILQPAQNAFMSEKASKRKRKFLFSIMTFSSQIGSALGLISIAFVDVIAESTPLSITATYQVFYIIYVLLYLLKLLLFFSIPEKYNLRIAKKRSLVPRSWRVIMKFCVTQAIIGIGAGIMVPWFPIFFKLRFDTSMMDLGMIFAINAVLWAVSALAMPLFAQRYGSVRTIVVSQLMAILIIVFIPNSPVFWIAAVFFILRMLLMNISGPVTLALQMNLCRENDRASLSSFNAFSWQISQATGTVIGGFLFAGSNLSIPFYVTAGFYVVYIITFWFLFKGHEDRPSGAGI